MTDELPLAKKFWDLFWIRSTSHIPHSTGHFLFLRQYMPVFFHHSRLAARRSALPDMTSLPTEFIYTAIANIEQHMVREAHLAICYTQYPQ